MGYLELAKSVPQGKGGERLAAVAPPSLERRWPPECLETESRFQQPQARLYPLLGHRVNTSRGPGKLLQVLDQVAAIVLDQDSGRATLLRWQEIWPLEAAAPGKDG